MGNTSEELKEIKKRAKEKKKVDTRYHLMRVKQGEVAPAGWLSRARTKAYFSDAKIEYALTNPMPGKAQHTYIASWYMYPGPKPDKKWGPVCP
jgi:hypothetical protein